MKKIVERDGDQCVLHFFRIIVSLHNGSRYHKLDVLNTASPGVFVSCEQSSTACDVKPITANGDTMDLIRE